MGVEGLLLDGESESLERDELGGGFYLFLFLAKDGGEVVQETAKFVFFVVDCEDGVGFSHCHDLSEGNGQVIGGDLSGQNA